MPTGVFRVGLAIFVLLAASVAANVLTLQPVGRRALEPVPKPVLVSAAEAAKPIMPEMKSASVTEAEAPDLDAAVRRELALRGYAPGKRDFKEFEARAAILAFESDAGLPLNGRVGQELLQHLLFGVARIDPQAGAVAASAEVSSSAREVIGAAQRSLVKLGYKLEANGLPSLETQRAIRDFEAANNLPETGRVSAPLMVQLARVSKLESTPVAADKLRARVASQR